MTSYGRIVQVSSQFAGTSTVGVEAVGQTVISVDDLRTFLTDVGVVTVGGVTQTYDSVDRAAGTITLSDPLTVALPAGSEIRQFPFSVQRWALVEPDTTGEDPVDAVWCLIPHSLAGFVANDGLREEENRERVKYSRDGEVFYVSDVIDKQVYLNPIAIPDNAITETHISEGAITTPLLAANAVKTTNLDATAITAKHTITGATVQTLEDATSGIKLFGNTFRVWDASDRITFDIDGETGDVTQVGTYRSDFSPNKRIEMGTGPGSDPLVDDGFSSIKFYSGGDPAEKPAYIVSSPSGQQGLYMYSGQKDVSGLTGSQNFARRASIYLGPTIGPINAWTQAGLCQLYGHTSATLRSRAGIFSSGASSLVENGSTIWNAGIVLQATGFIPEGASSGTATFTDMGFQANGNFHFKRLADGNGNVALRLSDRAEFYRPITGPNGGTVTLGASGQVVQVAGKAQFSGNISGAAGAGSTLQSDSHLWLAAGKRYYQSGYADPRVNDEGWVELPLVWPFYGQDPGTYGSPAYRIINGAVYLRGLVAGGQGYNGFAILPAWARPAAGTMHVYSVRGDDPTGAVAAFVRGSDGVMYTSTAAAFIFLAGIGPFPVG